METPHTLETMKAIIADCKLKCEKAERGEYKWKEGQSPRQFLFWAFSSPDYKMPEHLERQMELERVREQNKRREEAQKAHKEKELILKEQYDTFVQSEKTRIQESMDRQQWLKLQAEAVDKVKDKNKFLREMYRENPNNITVKVSIEKEFEKLLGIPDFETWQKE